MNHEANTIAWKMGDLVIHDDDAKRPDMLMRVLNRIASGPNKGCFRTRYAYPQHQPKEWQRKVWVNPIDKLHDPKLFNIDTKKVPADRFSRDLERGFVSRHEAVRAMSDFDNKHEIYASIRKSSKYSHQTERGARFPVRIGGPGGYGEYIVEGNGNRYGIRDLRFYIRAGDRFICISK
jgi:hypothetical protein